VPFFYGSLFGATLVAIGWILFTPAGTPLIMPEFGGSSSTQQAKTQKTVEQEQPERPRFDFYTILPEMEVVISNEEAEPPPADDKPATSSATASLWTDSATDSGTDSGTGTGARASTTAAKKPKYRLQVGSFKKMSDADRQKARLALLGVEAEIQKVNVGGGEVYHRVLTRPIASKSELNAKRKMFQQNRINSLVVQIKN
jgi:cell division protein FtsN